jgi:parallel beta-helix repeat protein
MVNKAFIIIFFFASTNTAWATDYFVSTVGSDSNAGTQSTPYKTIQKAIDQVSQPGDQIIVAPGDYRLEGIAKFINKHGSPDNNIVLRAQDPNQRPRLFGFSGIGILASSFITVSDFEILDITFSGIPIILSDHITIKNNYIHLKEDGFCTQTISEDTSHPYFGCTVGDLIGRRNKDGNPVVEFDGHQNTGIYICKSVDNVMSNNRIENADESIYVGTAGIIREYNCDYPAYPATRIWVEGNTIENNTFINTWNEGIELKPDTRNNIIKNNIFRNTRTNAETSIIEIRGHSNEIVGNIIVGAPNVGIRSISETATPEAAYDNYMHHNYVYYWSENVPNGLGINSHDKSSHDRIEHNTLVGTNQSGGMISEYYAIKSNSINSTVIKDNLMIGIRRYDSTSGSEKYEGHLTSYAGLPAISDYNAYYPKMKSNGLTCTVTIGSLGIICQTNSSHNQSIGYEFHSQFLDINPIHSDEIECSRQQLFSLPIEQLKERVLYCSSPFPNASIVGIASDQSVIGAWQTSVSTTEGGDFLEWLVNYPSQTTGVDYLEWRNNYAN